MQSEIQNGRNGKVNLYISGKEPVMGIDYPEAIRILDQAYTEEYAEIVKQIDCYISALRSNVGQILRVIDTLETVSNTIKTRHLGQ